MSQRRVGVALTGHWLPLEATLRLAQRADAGGFETLLVDGDETALPQRKDALLYDAGALAGAVLAVTRHARVGSIRLPGFSNAVLLARNLATLQEASGGRALGFFGVGSDRYVQRIGLPSLRPAQRIQWLDETLDALRELLAGHEVTREGHFARLYGARSTSPAAPVPIAIAAVGPRALRLVERHADAWDINLPPLPELVLPLRERLARPTETWIWVFARPGASLEDAAARYRALCPWFAQVPERALPEILLYGDPRSWCERLDRLRDALGIDVPILDLAGLAEAEAQRAIDAVAPAKHGRMD